MHPRLESSLQWGIVLLAVGAVLVLGSASGAQDRPRLLRNALRRDLVGCYKLMTARGQLLDPHTFYNASPLVYLDSTPRPHIGASGRDYGTVRRLLVLLDSTAHQIRREVPPYAPLGPSWSVDSLGDSLFVSFVDGFSGAELAVGAPHGVGDTLRGWITDNWDFGPPFVVPHGRGMAVRVRCAA